jgi:hypothetical protein
MTATLTNTGITFNDATAASSRASFSFPSGTVSLFYKQTAPTGWTAVTGQNNKMLRLVSQASAAGGSAGGTNAFTTALASRPVSVNVPVTVNWRVGPHTLNTNRIPPHGHPANNGGNAGSSPGVNVGVVNPGSSTGNYGNSGAHTHPVNYAANGPFSTSLDMRVQYCDVILCSFNG